MTQARAQQAVRATPAQSIAPMLLSIPGAASMLGVTEAAVRKWLAQRRLPVVKLGRLTRLKRSDLETVIQHGLPATGAHPRPQKG
jgi:excisionase family DNA binding protein